MQCECVQSGFAPALGIYCLWLRLLSVLPASKHFGAKVVSHNSLCKLKENRARESGIGLVFFFFVLYMNAFWFSCPICVLRFKSIGSYWRYKSLKKTCEYIVWSENPLKQSTVILVNNRRIYYIYWVYTGGLYTHKTCLLNTFIVDLGPHIQLVHIIIHYCSHANSALHLMCMLFSCLSNQHRTNSPHCSSALSAWKKKKKINSTQIRMSPIGKMLCLINAYIQ